MTTEVNAARAPAGERYGGWKRLLVQGLRALQHGSLSLTDAQGTLQFGATGSAQQADQSRPSAHIVVNRPAFFRKVTLGGSVGAGESYMEGDWDCDDLVALVRLFALNTESLGRVDGARTLTVQLKNLLGHVTRRNSRSGSRRNITAHYDLSNEFFATFLDERMMYSSAVYEADDQSLESASIAKLERLCRKLELVATDHLLEIGSGWGGLAVYAAENFGCRVTTITISPAQHAAATQRVADAGLQDRVEVLLQDYRELQGSYDKLVSVEMVEAVGHQYLPQYFSVMNRLVRPNGLIALQAITIEDRRYRQALNSVDFIKKHIFPGSFIPCVSELVSSAAKHTDMVLVNLEDIGLDYAWTLKAWRERVYGSRRKILDLGFDERLLRMWEFYLAYCEGGFRERSISDVQMLFAKPAYRGRAWRSPLAGSR
jgi:cyclopropane-fatty-acyl-phospholipid synthase